MNVSLVLTHACNLACTYCYTGEKKIVRMSRATADRALDLAFAGRGPVQVSFFGGEPTLEWDLLCEVAVDAHRRARAADVELALQMTTNGTLLDAARIDRLNELGVRVALSLDGVREQHERVRPLAGGGSSYEATRRALDLLLAAGAPFDVIMVVDPDSVTWIGESVRTLLDAGVRALTLNPSWGARWNEESLGVWRAQYEYAAAILVAWLRRGRKVRVQPFDSAIFGLIKERRDASDLCAAGERSVAVAPSGRLYACSRSVGEDDGRLAIGTLEGGINRARVGLATGEQRGAPECSACEATARCERQCACACREETGDAGVPGPVLCWHQHLVEELARKVCRILANEKCPTFLDEYYGWVQ